MKRFNALVTLSLRDFICFNFSIFGFLKLLKPNDMVKYIFTVFLAISTWQFSAQQIQRQKVIVEVGTGTWCGSCPAVVDIIHDLENAGANIAVVEYHNNDPYANADALIRENYYSFPWFPTTYYDSNHIGYDDWATYSVHYDYYETRNNLPSSFSLSITDGDVDNLEVSGSIFAEKLATYTGENLVLHVVLTESNIPENWQGETELDYVERLMYPDGNGTPIDFSGSSEQNIVFNFTLDALWEPSNCEITYFIQDNDTKEILQGNKISLDELSSLAVGDEISLETTGIIYPNPTNDVLSIYSNTNKPIKNIEIFDVMGKMIYALESYESALNLSELSKGIYMITYLEGDVYKATKIIKK